MKVILILFFVIGLIPIQIIVAQVCVNEVSTDPRNTPTQSHLDALPVNNNTPDLRFLNAWHWWYDTQTHYTIPINNMGQTAGSYYGSIMSHFNHSSSSGYYEYLSHEYQTAMHPDNGWELIADNRGWYPDSITEIPMNHANGEWTSTPELRSIPYLLFYNKYTGIARVFARYGNNQNPGNAINAAEISLYHKYISNGVSGILRLADGLDRTLDENTLITRVSAIVPSPGDEDLWFSTDFQLAYDPCVCDYESQIELSFRFLNQSELNIHGAGFSTPVNLLQDDNLFTQDFLNAFDKSGGVDNGYMIYKEMAGMINEYYDRLKAYQNELDSINKHNSRVDANVALLEIAKTVFTTGITAVTGMPNYSSLIGLIPFFKGIPDTATFGPKTQKEFWKQLDKALGMGFDLLMKENFTKKPEPDKPSMPTATATEMRFSGSITHSTPPFTSKVINTPGSKNANSNGLNLDRPQRYPIYNEALGVFALLSRPEIDIFFLSNNDCYTSPSPSNPENDATFVERQVKLQMKLREPLSYIINPSLNVKNFEILAGFSTELFLDRISVSKPDENVNINSIDFLTNDLDTVIGDISYNSIYVPIDVLNTFTSQVTFESEFIKSPFFPCGTYMNQINDSISQVFLKLIVNITYEGEKSDGTPHEYTYMFTYKIDPADITWEDDPIYPNLPGSAGDISQYPEDLYLNGVDFDGDEVDGCKLNGTTYLCKAWNDVEVTGTFSVANGYQVNVQAGNELRILPESMTPPEMTFSIVPVLDFSNPMPPVDHTFITTFCAPSGAYNARTSTKSLHEDTLEVAEDVAYPEFEDIFSLNLYPNPTGGNATLELTIGDRSVINLQVTDISGKPVVAPITNGIATAGVNRYELQTESLAKGIYFVHLVVNGEQHVKRLVKN